MAWIESHEELAQHPKTRRLAKELGVSIPAAIGHLHCLWWWALKYAQDGCLSKYDAEDIAVAAMYDGDGETIMTALINSRFLDDTAEGLFIHDWDDYAGKLGRRRERNKEQMRRARSLVRVKHVLNTNEHEVNTCKATQHNSTQHKIKDKTISSSAPADDPPPPVDGEDISQTADTDTADGDTPDSGADTPDKPPDKVNINFDALIKTYAETCPSLPPIRIFNERRKTAVRNLVKHTLGGDKKQLLELFRRAEASDFLTGRDGGSWSCGFDWIIKPANAVKILEGNYDSERNGRSPPGAGYDGIPTINEVLSDDTS